MHYFHEKVKQHFKGTKNHLLYKRLGERYFFTVKEHYNDSSIYSQHRLPHIHPYQTSWQRKKDISEQWKETLNSVVRND